MPRGYRAPDPSVNDDELKAIFERTYGGQKRERNRFLFQKSRQGSTWAGQERRPGKPVEKLPECLLVDGYNIIFAWEELKELTKVSLDSARGRLLDLMSNYQGYKDMEVIVVFDAYRVAAHKTEILKHNNIYVVYTKEAETADMYIEKTVREMNKKYKVSVSTSDALEHVIILGAGATRVSASGLKEELAFMRRDLDENYINRKKPVGKTYLLDGKNITL